MSLNHFVQSTLDLEEIRVDRYWLDLSKFSAVIHIKILIEVLICHFHYGRKQSFLFFSFLAKTTKYNVFQRFR